MDKSCFGCDHCGMDMDMTPYCVDSKTLNEAEGQDGRSYDFGLNTSSAWLICKGDNWKERKNDQ